MGLFAQRRHRGADAHHVRSARRHRRERLSAPARSRRPPERHSAAPVERHAAPVERHSAAPAGRHAGVTLGGRGKLANYFVSSDMTTASEAMS
ncbi:hypothetical protein EGA31_10390 [Mycobacterium avium subsp. paratuberculosis]|nr:hypothetical protein EGA31_10390 [Mycobacterium avium subsp. paratuberculosis]